MQFHHVGVEVTDLEASIRFYRGLGFQLEERMRLSGENIAFLIGGGLRLELVQSLSVSEAGAGFHLAFLADEKENPRAWEGAMDAPLLWPNGWRSFFVTGADGEDLELIVTA